MLLFFNIHNVLKRKRKTDEIKHANPNCLNFSKIRNGGRTKIYFKKSSGKV